MWVPGIIELAQSISWPDGTKGDFQALVSLDLFLLMSAVFVSCLVFVLSLGCSYICVASTSQVIG